MESITSEPTAKACPCFPNLNFLHLSQEFVLEYLGPCLPISQAIVVLLASSMSELSFLSVLSLRIEVSTPIDLGLPLTLYHRFTTCRNVTRERLPLHSASKAASWGVSRLANRELTDFYRGEPTGKSVKVASKHEAYIASPPADNEHKDVALLYIPDVIGIYKNSQLMADQFAANGYHTMIIDLFEGDAIPLNKPGNFDFMKWMTQGSDGSTPHTKESVDPIVEAAIKYLQDVCGAKRIGALGYCFGAKVGSQLSTAAWFLSIVRISC